MTITSQIKATCLLTCTVVLAFILSSTQGKAAEPLGVKIWDVSQIRPEVIKGNRKYVAVYGDISIQYHKRITIRDHAHPENFISVDLRKLSAEDNQSLRNCSVTGVICPLVITGFTSHTKLLARHAYFDINFPKSTLLAPSTIQHDERTIGELNAHGVVSRVASTCEACSHVPWDMCAYCEGEEDQDNSDY
jgi:hypothetical protein